MSSLKKIKYGLCLICLLVAFRLTEPPIRADLRAAQAYVELLPNGQFTEAAAVFENLSKETQNLDYQRAAQYIRQHSTVENFDFSFFYRQFLYPSVSLFNWSFSEIKADVKKETKATNLSNDLLKKRAELGHLLFYDPKLPIE